MMRQVRGVKRERRVKIIALTVAMICTLSMGVIAASVYAKYVAQAGSTFKMNIEKPRYTVVFDANGGEGEMENQTFIYGTAQQLSANEFTRDGYGFSEWNTMPDGSGASYTDKATVLNLVESGSGTITLYAQWEEGGMRTVFKHDGACTFNGADGFITGDECTEYADQKIIDTGVRLFDQDNYNVDFELGFTIVSYDPSANVDQAIFVNTKNENGVEGVIVPGLAVRKNLDKIEITQAIGGSKSTKNFVASSVDKIKIMRISGVVYYSINDGAPTLLQSTLNTSDYFSKTTTFGGAILDDGENTLFRVLVGTLSNMYLKVGNSYIRKHTITFDSQGGAVSPTSIEVLGDAEAGTLPVPTKEGKFFNGWYTEPEGGTRVLEDTVITDDMTVYAHWRDDNNVCSVGGVEKTSFQDCINAAGQSETAVSVDVLADIRGTITVNEGQNIALNLGQFVLTSNIQKQSAITNSGTITVTGGTIKSSGTVGTINNNSTGSFRISDGRIIATGAKQAIYNDGGYVKISGNSFLRASANDRATVHNLGNGTMIITGGTIISDKQEAVKCDNGTLIIGIEDGVANNNTPIIQGATRGVTTSVDIAFYDGILKGRDAAINNPSRITAVEVNAEPVDGVATVNHEEYHTLHYEQ